jgi:hypothetical protein
MPANPALQLKDWPSVFDQLVITPPAPNEWLPVLLELVARQALAALPFLPYLCFESLQALRRDFDAPVAAQSKPQELTFPGPPDSAFSHIHLQPQVLLDPVLNRRQRPFRRCLTAYVDIAVIGIPTVTVPAPIQFLIECVQVNVGQQRRQRSTLRRTLFAGHHHPLHHRAPSQEFPDQPEHRFVADGGSQPSHQDVVIDMVEELGNVHIDHPVFPLACEFLRGSHGVGHASSRSKPVAVVAEQGFEDRRQHLQQQLLNEPINHRRDA